MATSRSSTSPAPPVEMLSTKQPALMSWKRITPPFKTILRGPSAWYAFTILCIFPNPRILLAGSVHQHRPVAAHAIDPDVGLSDADPERREHRGEQLIDRTGGAAEHVADRRSKPRDRQSQWPDVDAERKVAEQARCQRRREVGGGHGLRCLRADLRIIEVDVGQ